MGVKIKVNEKYFKRWSRNMAYILGYLFADGSTEDWKKFRGRYVKAISTDRALIEMFKRELKSEHKIEIIPPESERHKTKYRLRIGSKALYNSLFNLGMEPKKSLTMKFPNIEDRYLGDFVRGYFDGDGCVYIEKDTKTKVPKRLRVVFTSGSHEFLKVLSSRLKSTLVLNQSKIYDSRRSFQLSYSTKDSLKVLEFFYGDNPKLYLRRKKRVFTKALKKCDNWKVNDREMATWRSS